MSSSVRITLGRRSRDVGTTLGIQLNTFGLQKLMAGVTGQALAEILYEAAQPCLIQAQEEWPRDTGASGDSIELGIVDSSENLRSHHAGGSPSRVGRVVLQVGGPKLIADPRNVSHVDYAPFIEFNGSPLGRGQGTIQRAIYGNQGVIWSGVHAGVAALVQGLVA